MDSEWKRVIGNPDNVIVSDSIRDLLDPGEVESEIKQRQMISFICTVDSGDETLSGKLTGFSTTNEYYKFYLELPIEDVSTLLGVTRFDNITISNSVNLVTLEIQLGEDDPDPEIGFDLGSSLAPLSSAFVSIVISK